MTPETKEAAVKAEAPEGWVLVPEKPTEQMLEAACFYEIESGADIEGIYHFMVGARPEPPARPPSTSQAGTPEGEAAILSAIEKAWSDKNEPVYDQHKGDWTPPSNKQLAKAIAALHPAPSSEGSEKAVATPLQWTKWRNIWSADTFFGKYVVNVWPVHGKGPDEYSWFSPLHTERQTPVESEEAGFAAAEADYQANIRLALPTLSQTEPQGGGAVGDTTQAFKEAQWLKFNDWWRAEGYERFPQSYDLTCKNACHAAWQAAALSPQQPAPSDAGELEAVNRFVEAVLHGDDDHREWLTKAAQCFVAGEPLPPPNGKGRAEAAEVKLAELAAELREVGAPFLHAAGATDDFRDDETVDEFFSDLTLRDLRLFRALLARLDKKGDEE